MEALASGRPDELLYTGRELSPLLRLLSLSGEAELEMTAVRGAEPAASTLEPVVLTPTRRGHE